MFAPCQRVKGNDMHAPVARRTAIRVGLAILALTASVACQSSSGADRGAAANTVATEPPATATTATTSPYAVPAVIDVTYVNRVLAGLDAVVGDVTRLVVRTKTIPREAYDRIKAVYVDPDFMQLTIDNFQTDIRRNFAGYKPEPGNKLTLVTELITAQSTCIFAKVKRDYSNVAVTPSTSESLWVAIKPLDQQRDPNRYNTTSWAFSYDGYPPDRSQPRNPCAV
jgi:hypothetical protein